MTINKEKDIALLNALTSLEVEGLKPTEKEIENVLRHQNGEYDRQEFLDRAAILAKEKDSR